MIRSPVGRDNQNLCSEFLLDFVAECFLTISNK